MGSSMAISGKSIVRSAANTVELMTKSKYAGQDPLYITLAKLVDEWGDWARQENYRFGYLDLLIRNDRLCKIFDNKPATQATAIVGFTGAVGQFAKKLDKKLASDSSTPTEDKRNLIKKLHSGFTMGVEATGTFSYGCTTVKILSEVEVIFLAPEMLEVIKKTGKFTGNVAGYLKSAIAVMEFAYCVSEAVKAMSLTAETANFTDKKFKAFLPDLPEDFKSSEQTEEQLTTLKQRAVVAMQERANYRLLISLIGVVTAVASFYITWRVGRLQVYNKRIDFSVVIAKTAVVGALIFELSGGLPKSLIGDDMPIDASAIDVI